MEQKNRNSKEFENKDFDAIQYINTKFPNEDSLVNLGENSLIIQ